jgi:hypothetical protein
MIKQSDCLVSQIKQDKVFLRQAIIHPVLAAGDFCCAADGLGKTGF